MPLYEFEREDGARVELFFHMRDAPGLDEVIVEDGVSLTRVLSVPQVAVCHTGAFVSRQIPSHDPTVPHKNAKGHACFESAAEASEWAKRTADRCDPSNPNSRPPEWDRKPMVRQKPGRM